MMQRKIILFTLIGFFVTLFIPVAYVSANSVFIGVTIDSAVRNDGISTFCLPNNTKISIMDNSTLIGAVKSTESTTCAGQTMWSNLIALDSGHNGHNYSVKLDVPNCYGPVFFNVPYQNPGSSLWIYSDSNLYPDSTADDQNPAVNFYAHVPSGGAIIDTRQFMTDTSGKPICWIISDYSENCYQTCATAGLGINGLCNHYDPNCLKTKNFLSWKFTATECRNSGSYPRYSTGGHYSDGTSGSSDQCDSASSAYYRLCPCSYQINAFSFPFTPVF